MASLSVPDPFFLALGYFFYSFIVPDTSFSSAGVLTPSLRCRGTNASRAFLQLGNIYTVFCQQNKSMLTVCMLFLKNVYLASSEFNLQLQHFRTRRDLTAPFILWVRDLPAPRSHSKTRPLWSGLPLPRACSRLGCEIVALWSSESSSACRGSQGISDK